MYEPSMPSGLNALHSPDIAGPLKFFNAHVQLLNDNTKAPRCDGSIYGYDLDKDSCLDAWAKIPTDNENVSFGARTHGDFEVPLPSRSLSCKSPP